MKSIMYLFIALIVAFGLLFIFRPETSVENTAVDGTKTGTEVDTRNIKLTADLPYFNDDSKVMYFWFDDCIYCKQQSPILEEITAQYGYQVKSMNVEERPEYWEQYSVGGTPAFLAESGERLSGLQTKEDLIKLFEDNQ